MGRLQQMKAQSVGIRGDEQLLERSANHFKTASIDPSVQTRIAAMGLNRVAGNIFICPSNKDFWQIKNGKIVRMVEIEVDEGQTVASGSLDDPQGYLRAVLRDLTF